MRSYTLGSGRPDRRARMATAHRHDTLRVWMPSRDAEPSAICTRTRPLLPMAHLHQGWQFAMADAEADVVLGRGAPITVGANEILAMPPLTVHAELAPRGSDGAWNGLVVPQALFDRIGRSLLPAGTAGVLALRGPVVRDVVLAGRLRALLLDSAAGALTGAAFAHGVESFLRELILDHAVSVRDGRAALHDQPVARAKQWLDTRSAERMPLSDLAALAGLSVAHFSREFHRVVGLPPQAYHVQVRLALAQDLLAQGRSISWVAFACGFGDHPHFCKRFRELLGVTPGEYQRQALGSPGAGLAESA